MKFQQVPKTDLDYVKFYAEELKKTLNFLNNKKS